MNLQPTLNSALLQVRPLTSNDYEALYLVASDPKLWEQHPSSDRYLHPVFEKLFEKLLHSKGALVIIDQKIKKIIGSSSYYDYSPENSSVIIGYTFMSREYWGGLYNSELKKLMINHAFKSVHTVIFHVGDTNTRSKKAMGKIGGVETGRIQKDYGQGPRGTVVYEIKNLSDYYLNEQRQMVFTSAYHLRRGECCGNICRHCPYDPVSNK